MRRAASAGARLIALLVAFAAAAVAGYSGVSRLLSSGSRPEGPELAAGLLPPLVGRVLLVDPGHGGIDSGCNLPGLLEKDINLHLARLLADALTRGGARVYLTRESDEDLADQSTLPDPNRHRRALHARVEMADRVRPDLVVSLHVNAARTPNLGGALSFYQPQNPASRQAAQAIQTELQRVLPGNQNGILPASFYLLRNSRWPVVLVETGFLTNPADRALLSDEPGRRRIAMAIYQGLVQYLTSPVENEPKPTLATPAPGFEGLPIGVEAAWATHPVELADCGDGHAG